ncbi:type II toxin-antitoxin system RelE/ParE family toxin [Dryocola clanedunensis]|uniref:type II toxin-antitoxin system RelE/ParE family toxin n=1 Tax=Cedecea sulfonylureivorans TaxID=3051154 RepID=UPI0019293778|nr:type II toxin-antitoxin system RelE/ParE family toxin [Cedecea sulfonylureivorans]
MTWTVLTTRCFDNWFDVQSEVLQDKTLHAIGNLQFMGPGLPRPYADTVKGSHFANMKELRIRHYGRPFRVFYAFDYSRQAILLCAGDKSKDKRFYESMIAIADREFIAWLSSLEEQH